VTTVRKKPGRAAFLAASLRWLKIQRKLAPEFRGENAGARMQIAASMDSELG
jgi:hypothetical protein